jgi:class 3 adenylate cyclase/tetratricopeptide (TPR) repeat protein
VCSVVFCDLVGFTPLAETRDPEEVRELLSRYFAVARTVIGRYGGMVEKFIGDAVMAVWGAPTATERDAERAVRAALELVQAVAELGADTGIAGLTARAGVVTGQVAVTVGAVGEGMVAGDAVNTAARIQSAAGPGQVLADLATQRLAESAIGFADAGEHALKGKAEPQRLWRATRVLSGIGGAQRVDGLEAPLTGRDAELRTIRDLFHAAAGRRVPRLVLVSGPPGVGKSRLGWEFEKYTDGLAARVWWHRGRCLSYGDGVAFWALAEIIRARLGIAEEDLAEVAAVKLAEGLDRFISDSGERSYVGRRLGRLLGVAVDGDDGSPLGPDELFAGWRLFFERLAASRPVILLIEDAHYADSGLLDFLDYLVNWVQNLPVYMLVFARAELARTRPGFGTGRNRATLALDPLDPVSMDRLVDALVPGMPAGTRAKITGHAQGNPLFAVETVRSLIDRDIVRPAEGIYRLVGEVDELAVPDSLHALLAARLDSLDPQARRLLADAALLGTAFTAEALTAVSGRGEDTVRAVLADLARREVLSVSADPLSPERGSYQFAQQMLRQVAYDTLSRRDRKAGHLKVAAYLRAAFPGDGEEVAEIIAQHYLDALHAVPGDPDVGAIGDQATAVLIRGAERAERAGAPARAATSYAKAADLRAADDRRVEPSAGDLRTADDRVVEPSAGHLWQRAAKAAIAAGRLDAAAKYADQARGYHLRRGDLRAAALAQVAGARVLRDQGRHGDARDQLTAALEVLRAKPDADTVHALEQLGTLEVLTGSPDADARTTEALIAGQAVEVGPVQKIDLLTSRAIYLLEAGRRDEGLAYLAEATRRARQVDSNSRVGTGLLNLAHALAFSDPAAAAEAARAACGHLRLVGELRLLSFAVGNLVNAQLLLGEWDAAGQEIATALASDGLAEIEYFRCYRGWLAALRGDIGGADAVLAALPGLRASENPQDQAFIAVVEAHTAVARREPGEALRHARRALGFADVLGISHDGPRWAWPEAVRAADDLGDTETVRELLDLLDAWPPGHVAPMLRAERGLARARLAAGDGDPAPLNAAIAGLRQDSSPYHLAHGLLDQARFLAAGGGTEESARAITEARAIGRRLGCQPLLDRAEAVANMKAGVPTR